MSWEDILKEQGPLSNFIGDLLYDFPDAELSVVEQKRGFAGKEISKDASAILRIVRSFPLELQNKLVAPIGNLFRYRTIEGVGPYFGDAPKIQSPYNRQFLPTSVNVDGGPPNFGSFYVKAEIINDDVFEFALIMNNTTGGPEESCSKA